MLVGLLIACYGFRQKPAQLSDLIRPRFAVPMLFLFLGYYPAIYYQYFDPAEYNSFARFREPFQNSALAYITLCFIMFWIGFKIPAAKIWARRTAEKLTFRADTRGLARLSIVITIVTASIVILARGGSIFEDTTGEGWSSGSILDYIVLHVGLPMNVIAVILFGISWPGKGEPGRLTALILAPLILILASLNLFAAFSRASGIMPFLMVLGYMGRWKKVPAISLILSILFVAYGAYVGLNGRGIYGHYGGVIPFFHVFLSPEGFSIQDLFGPLMADEVLTPLCVVMSGVSNHIDLNTLPAWEWVLYQIPVPHMFGIASHPMIDSTEVVGGVGSWGYTSSMFGDTFGNFGWWGCIAFVYLGMLNGILERVVAAADTMLDGTNASILLLPIAYYAFLQGAFNTFRAWNSSFVFGITISFILLRILHRMSHRQMDDLPMPALAA